ncbi:MAG: energy transducer TonB [Rhodobacteraceae bacterium]|nr:energy transducer TonB [Paracoccaceae bacterium]
MTALAGLPPGFSDRMTAREALLWSGAALAALSLHAGFVLWSLRTPEVSAAAAAPPAAVMIDLAPVPAAPAAEETEIAPDLVDSQQIEAEMPDVPKPVESPVLPVPQPAEPVERAMPMDAPAAPSLAEPVPDVTPPPDAPPSEVVEARPVSRPKTLEPLSEPVERREVTEARRSPAPSQAARRARVADAAPSETAAAPETSRGGASRVAPARWTSRLMAHLERRKRYPSGARRRHEEGVAQVRFRIDAQGHVLGVALARSSGFPELDAEVLAMVRRASPVPAPPPGAPLDLTVPVQFRVR